MMGVLALSFSWVLAIVTVQQNLTASISAQTVADAVALAAVENGESAARELAELNDALVVSVTFYNHVDQNIVDQNIVDQNSVGQAGDTAVVVIEIDGVQAQATASKAP